MVEMKSWEIKRIEALKGLQLELCNKHFICQGCPTSYKKGRRFPLQCAIEDFIGHLKEEDC